MKKLYAYTFDSKWVFCCILVIALLFLLPLLYIARFTHASADDFSYGNHTVETWRETGSIPQTISAAIDGTRHVYNTWQGSFIAVFLMTLHPAVFSESLYMFGLLAVMLGFIVANLLLLKVVFIDCLKADKYSYGILALIFIFVSLQFIFSPVEGLFWYNSAMYYTGFHAVSLVLFALTLLCIKTKSHNAMVMYTVGITVLSFLVGGGNFVTSLTSAIVMVLIFAYCLLVKRERWLAPLLGTVALSVALVIAVIAPGNAVRQAYFQSMSPLRAVYLSFEYGLIFIRLVISAPVWFAFAAITPLIYRIVKSSGLKFRLPVLAVALFYGVYSSTFTPNLYSWSGFGPNRVANINLFAFLFFMLASIIYLTGYMAQKLKPRPARKKKQTHWQSLSVEGMLLHPAITCILAACFVIACFTVSMSNPDNMASVSATRSLVTGEARTFHNENITRRQILQDPAILYVQFHEFTVTPHLLFFMDITSYATVWPNTDIARFYNKASVSLAP